MITTFPINTNEPEEREALDALGAPSLKLGQRYRDAKTGRFWKIAKIDDEARRVDLEQLGGPGQMKVSMADLQKFEHWSG